MLAEIITIGDEILIGQVVDTNSAWIAQKLNGIGIAVKQISSVSDREAHILQALAEAETRADLILITGGLGPTRDDLTKEVLCKYFNSRLVMNEEALENVKAIFNRFNVPLLDVNIRQAEIPDNCIPLQNKYGTAPGMWFERDGKIYISMPGVPHEMTAMMEEQVLPRLAEELELPAIVHQTLLTSGIGESFIAKRLVSIEDDLPDYIKLAYLPKLGQVRLRLSAYGTDKDVLRCEVDAFARRIREQLDEYLVAEKDVFIEEAILERLKSKGKTLSTAESCTGGYISHLLTSIPGSSAVFTGGVVAYSYASKEHLLGVQHSTLEKYGAVSEETVKEMALGAVTKFGSDFSIACSGIAGPEGGTPDKPVGTVWIAVAHRKKVVAKKFSFGNKRAQNIERTAISSFNMLLKLMNK